MLGLKPVIRALAKHGSPSAVLVQKLAESGDWQGLQRLEVDPLSYKDSETLWKDNLVVNLCRKMKLPGDKEAKRQAAVEEFFRCEARNAETNQKLVRFRTNHDITWPEARYILPIVEGWRAEIANVMGPLPRDLSPRFSGGATLQNSYNKTVILDKVESVPCFYSASSCLEPLFERTSWGRLHSKRRYVNHNVFFTVPKDGNKDRGCCKEAGASLGYQLAAANVLLPRLKRYGWDLEQGWSLHRTLAEEASVHGMLSTEDMSSASDLMARELVRLVVRPDWLALFDSLRAPMTEVDERRYWLEKYSSMGNGFTFVLETILFGCLARVIARRLGYDPDTVKVYGDDIILPTGCSRELRAYLSYFGFLPNAKKSFNTGPFRESCGGDFFLGASVRTPSLSESPSEPQQWISLHNVLKASACAAPEGAWRRARLEHVKEALEGCLANIPSDIRRCRGPSHLGDIVIHDAPERWTTRTRAPKGEPWDPSWDQVWVRAYTPVHRKLSLNHWNPAVVMACVTLGISSTGMIPRGFVSGYKFAWVPIRGLADS